MQGKHFILSTIYALGRQYVPLVPVYSVALCVVATICSHIPYHLLVVQSDTIERPFDRDCKNRGLLLKQVLHDKDTVLLKGHRCRTQA